MGSPLRHAPNSCLLVCLRSQPSHKPARTVSRHKSILSFQTVYLRESGTIAHGQLDGDVLSEQTGRDSFTSAPLPMGLVLQMECLPYSSPHPHRLSEQATALHPQMESPLLNIQHPLLEVGFSRDGMFLPHQTMRNAHYFSQEWAWEGIHRETPSHRWFHGLLYLFPPIPLLSRTIIKLRQDNSQAILIAPWWPRQPWFSTLLTMSVDHWRLPFLPDLLTQDEGRVLHPNLRSLHLTAWRISPP